MGQARSLDLLARHADLLSAEKQAIARWLCDEWAKTHAAVPAWLRQRYWTLYPINLALADAPEKLLRELALELLSLHRDAILARDHHTTDEGDGFP
jgi:hypothetical protein